MTFLFLRKFLSLLLSVLLSGIVPVFASQVDDIVASARPDRSTSLSYRGSKNNSLSFKEYYLSGEGKNCSFHGFGVNREDGIRSIYEKAFGKNPSNTLKDLLSKSIAFEIENREREFAIFGIDLNRVRLDTKSEEIQKQYLNHYKNCTDLIECAVNFDADGKPLEKTNYSLLNALAYAQNKSLMVYQKDKNFNLLCLHKFSLPQSPTLHLILNPGHYNLLVSSTDEVAQKAAKKNEDQFLEDLRKRIADENLDFSSLWNFDQESYPDIGLDEFTGDDLQRMTTTTTTSITPESLMRTLFPEEEWSNIEDDGERASLPNASPQESTPDSSEEVQPTFRFTDSDFESFLHQKRQTLKGARTVRESLKLAYRYVQDKKRKSINGTKDFYSALLCQAKLLLERDYLSTNKAAHHQEIHVFLDHLKTAKAPTKLLANYALIYQVKALKALGKYQEAYDAFVGIGKRYTKSATLDVAEMIIEGGFVPRGSTSDEATAYALTLLKKTPPQAQTRRAGGSRTEPFLSQKENRTAHPEYISSRHSRDKAASLKRKAAELTTGRNDSSSPEGERPQRRQRIDSPFHHSTPPSHLQGAQRTEKRASQDQETSGTPSNKRPRLAPVQTSTPVSRSPSPILSVREEEDASFLTGVSFEGSYFHEEENVLEETEISRPDANELYTECRRNILKGKAHKNEKAAHFYLKALKIAREQLQNQFFEAQALIGLGNARHTDGSHPSDASWYLEALELLGDQGDPTLRAQALIGLGNYCCGQKNNKAGAEYFEKALEICHPYGLKDQIKKAQDGLNRARRYLRR